MLSLPPRRLPALASAKKEAQATQCKNNSSQLLLAWTMYAGDFRDVLAYNIEVLKDGRAERIAVDANSDEVIADPGAMGLGDLDPGDFLAIAAE